MKQDIKRPAHEDVNLLIPQGPEPQVVKARLCVEVNPGVVRGLPCPTKLADWGTNKRVLRIQFSRVVRFGVCFTIIGSNTNPDNNAMTEEL